MADLSKADIGKIVKRFEKAHGTDTPPAIDDFLTGDGPARWALLRELVHSDLELRLQAGQPAALADYLARYPELENFPEELARILETEVKLHLEKKRPLTLSGYEANYPLLGKRVRDIFRRVGDAPPDIPGYELLDKIGQGGMGAVYRARQEVLRREVAVKVIRGDKLGDPATKDRITRRMKKEPLALAKIKHPNVVQVFDTGEHAGDLFLVMELVRGRSLQARLDEDGVLAPRLAAEWVAKIARAIQAAHDAGIIHRDLKPDNVLLEDDHEPKVVDFGLARPVTPGDGATIGPTNQLEGTPAYLSPEQAMLKDELITPLVDVHGLGAVLYAGLTGRPPFVLEDLLTTLQNVKDVMPVAVRELRPDVPRDLETICMKCLAKEPGTRYATARAVADDLERYLKGEPILARPVGRLERAGKWVKRNKTVSIATLAVVAALLTGTAVSLWQAVRATHAERDASEKATTLATLLAEERRVLDLFKLKEASALVSDGRHRRARELLSEIAPEHRCVVWTYLSRQHEGGLFTLWGHADEVTGVAFSRNGRRIVTGSRDNTACVWEAATGQRLATLTGHAAGITSVAVSPDGERVVTGSGDTTAKVWDRHGRCLATLTGHAESVTSVDISPDGRTLVTGSWDNTAKLWAVETGRCLRTLAGHGGDEYRAVSGVAFSPDGRKLVTGSLDATAKVWDVATGECLLTMTGHHGFVEAVTFSPDGRRVATVSHDMTAKIWNAQTGQVLLTLTGHTDSMGGGIYGVAFSPDGHRLATAASDHTVKVWEAASGRCLTTLFGHMDRVSDLAFSPDGRRLLTGSADATAKVWDAGGDGALTLDGHADSVTAVACSPDGMRIATASRDQTVKLWDATTGLPTATLTGHTKSVTALAYTPDGTRIVTGSRDKTARVWDSSGRCLATLAEHSDTVAAVAVSPDGRWVATAGDGRTAKLWEWTTGRCVRTLAGHTDAITAIAISPDGLRVVTGSRDHTAKIWDGNTGECLWTLSGHETGRFWDGVTSVAFHPSGDRVISGGDDGTVRVWDVATGRHRLTLEGHAGSVTGVAYGPDGTRILSAASRDTIRVWDAATGQSLVSLSHGLDSCPALAVSPDGRRIVVGTNTTARVWDLGGGQDGGSFINRRSYVESLALSPDGSAVAIAEWPGETVQIHDPATGDCSQILGGHPLPWQCLAFSPDGQRLARVFGGVGEVWDLKTGRRQVEFSGSKFFAARLAFSRDGRRIVVWGKEPRPRVREAATGRAQPRDLWAQEGQPRVLDAATGQSLTNEPVPELVPVRNTLPDGRLVVKQGARVAIVDLQIRPEELVRRRWLMRASPGTHAELREEFAGRTELFAAAVQHAIEHRGRAARAAERGDVFGALAHSVLAVSVGPKPPEIAPRPRAEK